MALFSVSADAGLIFTDDKTAFEDSILLGASDNFEDLGVAANVVLGLPSILTRGDFSFTAGGSSSLVGLGSGFGALSSVGLAPDLFLQSLTIDIAGGYNAFGFDVTANGVSTLNISIYDTLNNLIDLTSIGVSNNNLSFFGVFSDVAIGRILLDDGSVGGPIVDNIIAGTTEVPEPSTFVIFALGLLSLLYRFKKQA